MEASYDVARRSRRRWPTTRVVISVVLLSAAIIPAGCRRSNSAPIQADSTEPAQNREFVTRVAPVFSDEIGDLTTQVAVRNDTPRPIRFSDVQYSCSCTGAELEKRELAPNEETLLDFRIRTYGRSGPQRFVCTLVEEGGARWVYTVDTTVYAPHRFENDRVHFGLVNPKEVTTKETALLLCSRSSIAEAARALSFLPTSEAVTVTPGEARHEVLPDGTHQTRIPIRVVLRAPAEPGFGGASVRIGHEGASAEWSQEITWNVRSLLSVLPRQIFFGSVTPGSSLMRKCVTLRRLDGNPLRIVSLRVPGKVVSATVLERTLAEVAEIEFVLDGQQVQSSFWEEAVIEIDHPVQRLVTIPVAWVVPREKVNPLSLDHHKETGK